MIPNVLISSRTLSSPKYTGKFAITIRSSQSDTVVSETSGMTGGGSDMNAAEWEQENLNQSVQVREYSKRADQCIPDTSLLGS